MNLASVATAVPFLVEGVKQGEKKAVAIYDHAIEIMTRELETYDFPKVVVQGVAGTLGFFTIKAVWGLYCQLKIASFYASHTTFASIFGLNIPFMANLISAIMSYMGADLASDEEKAAYQTEVLDDPAIKYGTPIFETYWFYAVLAIWLFIALYEKQRVDKLKRKRRQLIRMVSR